MKPDMGRIRRRARWGILIALLIGVGWQAAPLAQPFTAQIQLALQTLGLWPYGGVYANGECPSWNDATQQFEGGACAGSAGAPADATYLTQTPNAGLSAEQALSALSTGLMRVETTTGVVTSLTTSAGIAANISDETGTGALVFGTSPTLAGGTIVNPLAALTVTQTWNDAADTFLGVVVTITSTASAAGSKPFQVNVGATEEFSVRKDGFVFANDSFVAGAATPTSGYYFRGNASGDVLYTSSTAFDRSTLLANNGATNRSLAFSFANATRAITTSTSGDELRSGTIYTTGDADGSSYTLPNDPVVSGLWYGFMVTQTQTSNNLSVAPSAGETLYNTNGSTCSSLTATAIGAYLEVHLGTTGSGGRWVITDNNAFTCVP